MVPLTDALAAPKTVQVGDKSVSLHPLTLNDYAAWDQWARAAHLRAAEDSLADKDPLSRATFMRDAHAAATRIYFGSTHAMGPMLSVPGRVKVAALSARMGDADVWGLVTAGGKPDMNVLNTLYVEALRLSGYVVEEKEGQSANPQDAVAAISDLLM